MAEISLTGTASSIQMDYMKLLITQLQNQNPLEPLDNNEMASQLAQFSQLSQLESMNSTFADVLLTEQRTYANSLIGKNVSSYTENQDGTQAIANGTVEQVIKDDDGKVYLKIGSSLISLEDVVAVKN